jgi:hypothetical protein
MSQASAYETQNVIKTSTCVWTYKTSSKLPRVLETHKTSWELLLGNEIHAKHLARFEVHRKRPGRFDMSKECRRNIFQASTYTKAHKCPARVNVCMQHTERVARVHVSLLWERNLNDLQGYTYKIYQKKFLQTFENIAISRGTYLQASASIRNTTKRLASKPTVTEEYIFERTCVNVCNLVSIKSVLGPLGLIRYEPQCVVDCRYHSAVSLHV